jgi:hypothetical protein
MPSTATPRKPVAAERTPKALAEKLGVTPFEVRSAARSLGITAGQGQQHAFTAPQRKRIAKRVEELAAA